MNKVFKDIDKSEVLQFQSTILYTCRPRPGNIAVQFYHRPLISIYYMSHLSYDQIAKADAADAYAGQSGNPLSNIT